MHPIYRHGDGDQRGFRLTAAQLVDSGACHASEVIAAFGISMGEQLCEELAQETFFLRGQGRKMPNFGGDSQHVFADNLTNGLIRMSALHHPDGD